MESSTGNLGAAVQAGIGGRYATALFELARDAKAVDSVERSLSAVRDMLTRSDDLRRLTKSPLVSRGASGKAVAAVAAELDLDPTTRNFLGVLAENRRLAELPRIIAAFRRLTAAWRGETSAEVVSAHPLDADQVEALKQQLRRRVGGEVSVDLHVDPALLGGLVVRIGSQMIDSSIRTRLTALAGAMRG